jgi:hypothetical protein
MITQDYFQLEGKAFPQGCTFSESEIKTLPEMKTYKVFVGDPPQEAEKWHAVNKSELLKALRATYISGTEVEILEQSLTNIGIFKL